MTDLAGDEAVEALVKKVESDRLVAAGYLVAHCRKSVINVLADLIKLGLDRDFAQEFLQECLNEFHSRRNS